MDKDLPRSTRRGFFFMPPSNPRPAPHRQAGGRTSYAAAACAVTGQRLIVWQHRELEPERAEDRTHAGLSEGCLVIPREKLAGVAGRQAGDGINRFHTGAELDDAPTQCRDEAEIVGDDGERRERVGHQPHEITKQCCADDTYADGIADASFPAASQSQVWEAIER